MPQASQTQKIVVFSKVLQILRFTGIRMIFPYVNDKGVYSYAAIEAEDMYKIIKWDVNAQGIKQKAEKKVTKKRK